MTVPSEINAEAPVLAHHEVEIQATLDEVWGLHTDVNAWTVWQSDITTASIEGAFEVGNSFSWSSYGLAVTSTIYAITDHSRILWGGTGAGVSPASTNGSSQRLRTVSIRRRMSPSRARRLRRTQTTCSRCSTRHSCPGSIT